MPNSRFPTWGQDFANSENNIPWLDFIRNYGSKVERKDNPFVSDPDEEGDNPKTKMLQLNPYFWIDAGGHLYPYVEEYWVRESPNHSLNLVFAVFLDNPNNLARIECYDPERFHICEQVAEEL